MDWYPRPFWGTPLVRRLTSRLAWVWIVTQAMMAAAAAVSAPRAVLCSAQRRLSNRRFDAVTYSLGVCRVRGPSPATACQRPLAPQQPPLTAPPRRRRPRHPRPLLPSRRLPPPPPTAPARRPQVVMVKGSADEALYITMNYVMQLAPLLASIVATVAYPKILKGRCARARAGAPALPTLGRGPCC